MYKFNKSQIIAPKTKEKSSILALCVNCEEFINMDRVDLHAQICTQVSNKILTFALSPICFEENDFKLKKLKKILQNKQYEHTQRLCRIIELVIQINSIGCVEEASLIQFEQELIIMSKEPIQSLNLSIYLERLHSLVIQRINIIQNQLNSKIIRPSQSQQNFYPQISTAFNSKLSKISSGSIQTPSNVNLQNLLINKVEQSEIVISDHRISQGQNSQNRMTTITRFSLESGNQQQGIVSQLKQGDNILTNISEQSPEKINENVNPKTFAQRCFYSKVLNQKLKYPSSSPAQKIPVSLLYKQAEQKQIKSENWDIFIKQCLDNPFEYLDPKKFNKNLNNSTQNQHIFKQ
ncbi:unnamed protein product [Paramecium primaurelia]|uniref:Uncharacterized protein n=1 Tax=Paramecium primaurelia TaxID=5886 RepID=A0A8S1MLA2_PARPR|nr:unnamed protein product [Paramecium primaurelia]